MTAAGWVAGDVIATLDDPGRGQWLTVRGAGLGRASLHPSREEARDCFSCRGRCVAYVTEHSMPGGIGYCHAVTPGTLTNRADFAAVPVDIDGRPVGTSPATCAEVLTITPSPEMRAAVLRAAGLADETGQCPN